MHKVNYSRRTARRPCTQRFDLRPEFQSALLEFVGRAPPSDAEMWQKTSLFDGQVARCQSLASPYDNTQHSCSSSSSRISSKRSSNSNYYYFLDPGTQFPGKKNYAMQRQNTKTSWNGLYSSSSFTKLSRSRIALKR